MVILGIETSCDETALALIEAEGDFSNHKIKIVAETLHSQIDLHKQYGGVYPMMAKREHGRNLIPLLKQLLTESNFGIFNYQFSISKEKTDEIKKILEREPELLQQFLNFIPTIKKPPIDAIAVTHGPGLEPALWVGINFAKALATVWEIPVIPTNHMEGHIFSVLADRKEFSISNFQFPIISLLVSGGHTELVLVEDWLKYKILGQTKDDAAGEAFDKVARILGLPYPGGPEISKLAAKAGNLQIAANGLKLPRPMINSNDYDFSFSGLKTAVLYATRKIGELDEKTKIAFAKEFEDAVCEVLIKKTKKAVEEFGAKTVIFAGGVSANKTLRESLAKEMGTLGVKTLIPCSKFSTDNAVMIAVAGYFRQKLPTSAADEIKARGNLKIS